MSQITQILLLFFCEIRVIREKKNYILSEKIKKRNQREAKKR